MALVKFVFQGPEVTLAIQRNGNPAGEVTFPPQPYTYEKELDGQAGEYTGVASWEDGTSTAVVSDGGSGDGTGSSEGGGG